MRIKKGNVDLITLVVGMIPMVLFIILSGYILVENPVQTDLGTQISFEEAKFESMMALSHVLVYNDTLEEINSYSEFPANPDAVGYTIRTDMEDSTSYLDEAFDRSNVGSGGNTRDRRNTRGADNGRTYVVNVTMPEEDDLSVGTSTAYGSFVSSQTNVASPKTDPITVKVVLNRD